MKITDGLLAMVIPMIATTLGEVNEYIKTILMLVSILAGVLTSIKIFKELFQKKN